MKEGYQEEFKNLVLALSLAIVIPRQSVNAAEPLHRLALQQPLLRLRRLLPAQGHQAASGQLQGCPSEPQAIVDANRTRKDFVSEEILKRVADLVYSGTAAPVVGVYRLTMKTGSDNFRARDTMI